MSHTATSIAKYEVAREHLDLAPISEAEASSSLVLCNSHYQQLYRELHFPLPCAACSSQPRYGGDYTRRCPDPVQISTYLQQTLDFSGILMAQSKICTPCYMFHRQILQKQNSNDSIFVLTLDTIASNLEGKIGDSGRDQQELQEESHVDEYEDEELSRSNHRKVMKKQQMKYME